MSKGKKWAIGLGVVAVLAVAGSAMGEPETAASAAGSTEASEPERRTPDGGTAVPTDVVITAEDVVDVMGDRAVRTFCDEYFVIGDYDAALRAFKVGYGTPPAPAPKAVAVFDEALTRC